MRGVDLRRLAGKRAELPQEVNTRYARELRETIERQILVEPALDLRDLGTGTTRLVYCTTWRPRGLLLWLLCR